MENDSIKPEILKTLRRLSTQGKFDVMKNKLRSWIAHSDISIHELLDNCKSGSLPIPHFVINKLGLLFGQGKEGLMEDYHIAFSFYEAASDMGSSSACGNCAQYYYDGRAPSGKDLDLAYEYCQKAIDLGADKYMLMAEILLDKMKFVDAVKYLRKVIEGKTQSDQNRKMEARILEKICYFKELQNYFRNGFDEFASDSLDINQNLNKTKGVSKNSKPSPGKLSNSSFIDIKDLNVWLPSASYPERSDAVLKSSKFINHKYPGWFHITKQLEGFDLNSCTELTAKAEILELECQALKSAFESAEAHIQNARKNSFSKEIIDILINTKVNEFEKIYESLQSNKTHILTLWKAYIDYQEHTLRRQSLAEKIFFDPKRINSEISNYLSVQLLHRRLHNNIPSNNPKELQTIIQTSRYRRDIENEDDTFMDYLSPDDQPFFNQPIYLTQAIDNMEDMEQHSEQSIFPPSRFIIAAERALFELAYSFYRNQTSHAKGFKRLKTGWTPLENPHNGILFEPNAALSNSNNQNFRANYSLEQVTGMESVIIGNSIIKYYQKVTLEINPSDQSEDCNFYMEDVSSSEKVYEFLSKLSMFNDIEDLDDFDEDLQENEKKIAELMNGFSRDGRFVTIRDLQNINEDATFLDCALFNKICYFYFVKRLVTWVTAFQNDSDDDMNEKYLLPLASAQARAIELVKKGIISFKEAFDPYGPYGIFFFTHENPDVEVRDENNEPKRDSRSAMPPNKLNKSTSPKQLNRSQPYTPIKSSPTSPLPNKYFKKLSLGMIDESRQSNQNFQEEMAASYSLKEKIIQINELYQKYILELTPANFLFMVQFRKVHSNGKSIPTIQQINEELSNFYGSDIIELPSGLSNLQSDKFEDKVLNDLFEKIKV